MATMMMKTTMMVGIAIRMVFSIGFLVIKRGLTERARSGLTTMRSATAGPPRRVNYGERGKYQERFHKIRGGLPAASEPARESLRSWLERLVRCLRC